jgi:prolyl 4-hydroxylase
MIATVAIVLIIVVYSMYTSYKPEPELEILVIKDKRKIVDTYKGFRRMRHIYDDFELWELYNILTEAECKKIIQFSEEFGFKDSKVYKRDGKHEVDSKYRTSRTAWVSNKRDPLIERIAQLTQLLTDLPIENQEHLQVAKYEEGGRFVPHFDVCTDDEETCDRNNKGAGQRVATLLMYLNDDFKGGETVFPHIGLSIRPKRGKAILFRSTDKYEQIYEEAKHQGMPVLEGKKYICTKWAHLRAYPVYH